MINKEVLVLQDALIALHEASESGESVQLINPPGSHASHGLLYFVTLFDAAKQRYPEVDAEFVFDAGDNAAMAMAAMRAGISQVRYTGSDETADKLQQIAKKTETELT